MTEVVPVRLHGYIAIMAGEYRHHFVVRAEQLVFEPKIRRRVKKSVPTPLYRELPGGHICVPFGIIIHYNKLPRSPVRFKVVERRGELPFQPLDYDHPAIAALPKDDWQRRALAAMQYARGGLLEAPTGAGKSVPLAALALAAARQHNVLFASGGTTIEDNFVETVERYTALLGDLQLVDYDHYRHDPDAYPERGCIIYAGSRAVLNDALAGKSTLTRVGTLIADEAHHGGSETYQSMLYALPNLVRSIGMSATLFEGRQQARVHTMPLSDAAVIGAHGPLLLRVRPQEVRHRIDLPDVANLRLQWTDAERSYRGNHWAQVYKMVKRHERRLDLICRTLVGLSGLGRTTVMPISDKEYGRKLLARCRAVGGGDRICCWYGAGELWTGGSRPERVDIAEMKEYVRTGVYDTLIVTSHVDESLDIPVIDTTFLTEGRKSRRSRQRAGRSVRRGKDTKSLVINLYDLDGGIMQSQASYRCNSLVHYYETKKYRFDGVADLLAYVRTLSSD